MVPIHFPLLLTLILKQQNSNRPLNLARIKRVCEITRNLIFADLLQVVETTTSSSWIKVLTINFYDFMVSYNFNLNILAKDKHIKCLPELLSWDSPSHPQEIRRKTYGIKPCELHATVVSRSCTVYRAAFARTCMHA